MTHDPRCPAWDANLECPHGRVPFDPSPICKCFPIEREAVVREFPVRRVRRPGRKKKAA